MSRNGISGCAKTNHARRCEIGGVSRRCETASRARRDANVTLRINPCAVSRCDAVFTTVRQSLRLIGVETYAVVGHVKAIRNHLTEPHRARPTHRARSSPAPFIHILRPPRFANDLRTRPRAPWCRPRSRVCLQFKRIPARGRTTAPTCWPANRLFRLLPRVHGFRRHRSRRGHRRRVRRAASAGPRPQGRIGRSFGPRRRDELRQRGPDRALVGRTVSVPAQPVHADALCAEPIDRPVLAQCIAARLRAVARALLVGVGAAASCSCR